MKKKSDRSGSDTSGKIEQEISHTFWEAMKRQNPGILERVRPEYGLPEYDAYRVIGSTDDPLGVYEAAQEEGKQFSTLQGIYDKVYLDLYPEGKPAWLEGFSYALMSGQDLLHSIHRVVELAFDNVETDRKNAVAVTAIESESRTEPA